MGLDVRCMIYGSGLRVRVQWRTLFQSFTSTPSVVWLSSLSWIPISTPRMNTYGFSELLAIALCPTYTTSVLLVLLLSSVSRDAGSIACGGVGGPCCVVRVLGLLRALRCAVVRVRCGVCPERGGWLGGQAWVVGHATYFVWGVGDVHVLLRDDERVVCARAVVGRVLDCALGDEGDRVECVAGVSVGARQALLHRGGDVVVGADVQDEAAFVNNFEVSRVSLRGPASVVECATLLGGLEDDFASHG